MRIPTRNHRIIHLTALLLSVAFVVLMPAFAFAESGAKTVRIGWYESPFNMTDQFGRRSGYAYEYQRKVAAYTGWNYQYVDGSWPELLEMLKKGEIDMMSDVSYTEERTEDMLFASLPMGSEAYYVFATPDNEEITADDFSSLNGKRVGVNKGSIQKDLFLDWSKQHSVEVELVDLTVSNDESLSMLTDGELDALITLDTYGGPKTAVPIFKIGSSDFYFAVNKNRSDLLAQLDLAMNKIQEENKFYNNLLYEKYLKNPGSNLYLTPDERSWLYSHKTIRVGYQDNYMAFCASAPDTGELTGALRDYLAYASSGIQNAELNFEPVAYPTASAAIEALNNGEVDCMFPANFTDYDGEELGIVMTPPLMTTEMDAVVRSTEQKTFVRKKDVTVAVNEGNPNYELFLLDHYPGWKTIHYVDTPTCLNAVAAGNADCIIISNYRFNNISKQCAKLHLTTVYTGVDMDYCFAVRQGDTALYSILSRMTGMVPESTTNAALTYYSTEDAKITLTDFLKDHFLAVLALVVLITLVIVFLLLRSIRAEKKADEEQHLVDALNKRVFVDALTSVRNKGAFANCVQEIQDQLNRGGSIDFAIGILDCDNLKLINDQYGHDKGDVYLKSASQLICRVFQHSPVFRIGGDEFAVILQNADYQNREALIEEFRQRAGEVSASAQNRWEEVHISLGIAQFDLDTDSCVNDTVSRADQMMYENKRSRRSVHR